MYSAWKAPREALENLKDRNRFSSELKTYIISIARELRAHDMTWEEIYRILGMWGGTLSKWLEDENIEA